MAVTNNTAERRYELTVDGETAIAAYKVEGDRIVFTHTVVPDAIGGRGVGTRLIEGALADVRRSGRKVVPACSFVKSYVDKHPDQQDLLG